jgi:hypothetical protein
MVRWNVLVAEQRVDGVFDGRVALGADNLSYCLYLRAFWIGEAVEKRRCPGSAVLLRIG